VFCNAVRHWLKLVAGFRLKPGLRPERQSAAPNRVTRSATTASSGFPIVRFARCDPSRY